MAKYFAFSGIVCENVFHEEALLITSPHVNSEMSLVVVE